MGRIVFREENWGPDSDDWGPGALPPPHVCDKCGGGYIESTALGWGEQAGGHTHDPNLYRCPSCGHSWRRKCCACGWTGA